MSLSESAKKWAQLTYKPKGKSSRKEHYEQVYKQTGSWSEKLDIDVHEAGTFIWSVFWELKRSIDCISFAEIGNYCKVRNVEIAQWEIDAVLSMDRSVNEGITELENA